MERALLLACIAAGASITGCLASDRSAEIVLGGDKERGRASLSGFGCGSCHVIPGIPGANGMVGPPLTMFARRSYIAGQLPNDPDNLVNWIRNPQLIEPGTVMPNLGVDSVVARDMAAYLYTLR